MRINTNVPEQTPLNSSQAPAHASDVRSAHLGTAAGAAGAATVDRIDLSETAEMLGAALGIDQAQRNEKVAALSALYQSGQFRVDPNALSEAILDHEEQISALEP